MKFTAFPLITIILLLASLCIKCKNTTRAMKFNKAGWKLTEDLNAHPNRERMLVDLIEHHKIIGLSYYQLIDSLGRPDKYGNAKDSVYYNIVDYNYPNPRSGKHLAIGFNKDSVITGLKLVEWNLK